MKDYQKPEAELVVLITEEITTDDPEQGIVSAPGGDW